MLCRQLCGVFGRASCKRGLLLTTLPMAHNAKFVSQVRQTYYLHCVRRSQIALFRRQLALNVARVHDLERSELHLFAALRQLHS